MKRYIYIFLGVILIFQSCKNANQKEIGEVETLIKIVESADEILHAIDTNDLYSITELIKADMKNIRDNKDTLTKEAAFKVDEYIGRTKSLYGLTKNYSKYEAELKDELNQLNNLKQDLENNFIKKDDFLTYYEAEQKSVLYINDQINDATNGMALRIKKMIDGREEFLELLENPDSYLSIGSAE